MPVWPVANEPTCFSCGCTGHCTLGVVSKFAYIHLLWVHLTRTTCHLTIGSVQWHPCTWCVHKPSSTDEVPAGTGKLYRRGTSRYRQALQMRHRQVMVGELAVTARNASHGSDGRWTKLFSCMQAILYDQRECQLITYVRTYHQTNSLLTCLTSLQGGTYREVFSYREHRIQKRKHINDNYTSKTTNSNKSFVSFK